MRTLDGRADQYALAATAFHLLIGIAAVSSFQSDGGHQPAPHRVAAGPRRPASRVVGARSGSGQGAFEGPQGPVQQLRGLRAGAGPPTRGRTGGGQRAHRGLNLRCRTPRARAGTKHRNARLKYAPAIIVPAILAALLLVAIALVLIQFREIERLLNDDYTATAVAARHFPEGRVAAAATATGVDDDGHRFGSGGSCGRGRRSQLLADRQPPQPPPTATPSTARLCSQRAPPSGR